MIDLEIDGSIKGSFGNTDLMKQTMREAFNVIKETETVWIVKRRYKLGESPTIGKARRVKDQVRTAVD